MALIKCPDCARHVSDAAVACVHCGRPMLPPGPATRGVGDGIDYDSTPIPTVLIPGSAPPIKWPDLFTFLGKWTVLALLVLLFYRCER